jgi:hypothetical protein
MSTPQPPAGATEPANPEVSPPLPALPEGLFCPECDYDLRALTSARCPECGFELEALRSLESQIPWVHRRKLGRFRAYWKTVWLVTFRSRRFLQEMARPVSYSDTQSFRWITTLHAWVASVIYVCVWPYFNAYGAADHSLWEWTLSLGCALLWLSAWTGIPSWFFHPEWLPVERQNRAVALSYYACAPLAWTPAAVGLLAGVCFAAFGNDDASIIYPLSALCIGTAALTLWWFTLLRLGRGSLRRAGPVAGIALGVPALWLALFLLVNMLQLVIFFIAVVFYSLR